MAFIGEYSRPKKFTKRDLYFLRKALHEERAAKVYRKKGQRRF